MPIEWNGFPRTDDIEQAICKGLSGNDIKVEVAGENFEQAVRNHPGYETFTVDRVGGHVGGKTLPWEDGLIILNMPALLAEGLAYVERITCHETGHIYTHRSGESRATGSLPDKFGDGDLRAMASAIIDEFRAEKFTLQNGFDDLPAPMHLHAGMHFTNIEILITLTDDRLQPLELAREILSLLNSFMKHLATYLVYDSELKTLNHFDSDALNLWHSLMGDSWKEVADILVAIPASNVTIENLDDLIDKMGAALRKVLTVWGFEITETEGHPEFLRTVGDDVLRQRYLFSMPFQEALNNTQSAQS